MSSHIEYQRFRRDESCTEEGCRARKFYIEDGKKFCQRGHEQAGFTQTQQDEDDWNAQGKKSRRKREDKERVETILAGSEGKELYLQCYQLILWKQCHWLVTALGLPEELRVIVKDLWALRISVLRFSRDDKSGYGSGTGTMMFSSASEGDNTDTDGTTQRSVGSKKSAVSDDKLPRLIETLGLCYLGMLLLKLPVSLGDVYKWASQDKITYSRAIKEVPRDMRSKLPAHFHSALECRAPLKGAALYSTVLELIEFYRIEFEMEFPSLNAPLLIFKYMKDLCLPVELYPAIRRLAGLLEVDFSYPIRQRRTYRASAYPEIQLVSLIVMATKLAHPFDDLKRIPESYSDPSAVRIDWSKWVIAITREPPRGLERGEEINIKDIDVWGMNARKLDDYLNWYQSTWIDDRDPKISDQIIQLFPLHAISPQVAGEAPNMDEDTIRLKDVQRTLLWRKPQPVREDDEPENTCRPGELYKRYRTEEELPEQAKVFFGLAASKAGISLRMLVKCVFQFEVQLENWRLADWRRQSVIESGY